MELLLYSKKFFVTEVTNSCNCVLNDAIEFTNLAHSRSVAGLAVHRPWWYILIQFNQDKRGPVDRYFYLLCWLPSCLGMVHTTGQLKAFYNRMIPNSQSQVEVMGALPNTPPYPSRYKPLHNAHAVEYLGILAPSESSLELTVELEPCASLSLSHQDCPTGTAKRGWCRGQTHLLTGRDGLLCFSQTTT